jgi:hypothetical protein
VSGRSLMLRISEGLLSHLSYCQVHNRPIAYPSLESNVRRVLDKGSNHAVLMVVEPARGLVSSSYFYPVSTQTNSKCGFQLCIPKLKLSSLLLYLVDVLRIRDDVSNIDTHSDKET